MNQLNPQPSNMSFFALILAVLIINISGQSDNFYITEVQFPVTIITNEDNVSITIENDQQFTNVFSDCNEEDPDPDPDDDILLRDDFDTYFGSCFGLVYLIIAVLSWKPLPNRFKGIPR